MITEQIKLVKLSSLKWCRSLDKVRYRFCSNCGSSLFYEFKGKGRIVVGAGILDDETGLHTHKHIYIKNEGEYY